MDSRVFLEYLRGGGGNADMNFEYWWEVRMLGTAKETEGDVGHSAPP